MMRKSQDSRIKANTQLTRSRDFGNKPSRDERDDTFKENEDLNSGLAGRLIQSVRVSMASSRRGRNMLNDDSRSEKNENLECKEDFFKSNEENCELEDTKHNIFAHQRSYSQSQGNLSKFFRQSCNFKPGQILPTKLSFQKQEIVHNAYTNPSNSRPPKPAPEIHTLKSCSSNQDLRSMGLYQRDSMIESKVGVLVECANKDGKKAKYRIVNSEEEEEMFYCSKCSIMLLQQGFRVQQLESSWQDPNVNRTLRRKSQIDRINNLARDLQNTLKKHAGNLDDSKYFVIIEEEQARICETYDYLLGVVEQMKAAELKRLQLARQNLVSEIQKQKSALFGKFTRLQSVRDELEEMTKVVSKVSDGEYSVVINESLQVIGDGENYEPLEFSINTESVEHKMHRLIGQITEYFSNRRLDGIQFSFDKSSNASLLDQSGTSDSKRPFRTLFPDDKDKFAKNKNFFATQSIQQCYEDSFASNKSSKFRQ